MPKKIKEKKCSVCQVIVKPPLQWWDSVNACSDCVRKAALDIQNESKRIPNQFIKMKQKYEKENNARNKHRRKGFSA